MGRRVRGEGSLFQRSDGLWVGRVPLPGGKVAQVTAKTQKEAKAKWDKLRRKVQDGSPITPQRLTIGVLLDSWLETHVKMKRAQRTYEVYEAMARLHLKPAIGTKTLSSLHQVDVDGLLAELSKTLSLRTVRLIHAILSSALNWAMKRDMIVRNVAKLVEPVSGQEQEVEPLSEEDVTRFLAALDGCPHRALMLVALSTGMRMNEILGLTWDSVSLETGVVKVTQQASSHGLTRLKTRSSRRLVQLPEIALEALKEHRYRQLVIRSRARVWQDENFVFSMRDGRRMTESQVRVEFKNVLAVAGITQSHRFHDLRHTAVSSLLSLGVPLHEVSRIAGHAGVQMTANTYGHLSPERRREAANRMGEELERLAAYS